MGNKNPRLEPGDNTDDRVAELEQENADLREQLSTALTPKSKKVPAEPSFGMCEGTRDELERQGNAVSPFTGRTITR